MTDLPRITSTFLPSRRALLSYGLSAAFAGAAGKARTATMPRSVVSGRVFADTHGDGAARPASRGIPGVRVSNGVDVVCTDAQGCYRIPAQAGYPVFVVKPAGYAVHRCAATNLPLHYRDFSATEIDGASLRQDFALLPTGVKRQFEAVLMADPQPETHRHLDFIRDGALPQLSAARASFGMTLGDIVGDELSLLERYNSIVGQVGATWWNAGGNHDLDFDAPDHPAARAPFRRAYGPATYAFEEGEALFIVLDNVEYSGRRAEGGRGVYRGHIGARQLAFVKNLLAQTPPDRLIVVAMHIPLRTDWNPESPRDNTADADALVAALSGRRAVSFSGHMHATEHQYFGAGGASHHHHVLAALSGSWWSGPFDHRGRPLAMGVDGCPPGFHVLHVDGVNYQTTFVPLHAPQPRLRAVLARCAPCVHSGALVIDGLAQRADMPCELVVNVFDGGPKTKVRMRLPGGEWERLARARRADPFMVDLFAQPAAIRHDWVKPEPCEHLWTGVMPRLTPGLHRIEIEVTDEYGRVLRDWHVAEVVGP